MSLRSRPGFVYDAFMIDVYACYIVGWRVSGTAHAGFVLDALEQAIHKKQPVHRGGLINQSNSGSQYVSIKYIERLAAAGIEPSVGGVGSSYDNAFGRDHQRPLQGRCDPQARAVARLRSRRVRHARRGGLVQPSSAAQAHRQHPPAEAEDQYYAVADNIDMAAWPTTHALGRPGAVQITHPVETIEL